MGRSRPATLSGRQRRKLRTESFPWDDRKRRKDKHDGLPCPLTTEDWARVRYEYECTARKVVEICAEHGISEGTLRDRVRRWGWTPRWSGGVPREGPPPVVVSIVGAQAPEGSPAGALAAAKEENGDPPDEADALRESLKRQIDAIIAEEREARPRRYLAAWEEFAAEAAKE